jgi:hypothetical protein
MGPMFFGTYLITLHRCVQRIKCGMGLNAIFYRTSVQLGEKKKGFIHYPLGKLKIFALGSSIYSSSHGTWVNFLTVFNAIEQFSSMPTYFPYLGEELPRYQLPQIFIRYATSMNAIIPFEFSSIFTYSLHTFKLNSGQFLHFHPLCN